MSTESKQSYLTEDEFFSRYLPVKNHIDINASFEGCLFETFGDEFNHVKTQNPNHVFTYLENDSGVPCIVSGMHLVNRVGYFVTQKPFEGDIYVSLDIDDKESLIFQFNDIDCHFRILSYENGQPAIEFYAADTERNSENGIEHGDSVLVPSLCIDSTLHENETAIKAYGENEGVLELLVAEEIVVDTNKLIYIGDFAFPIVKICEKEI